MIGFLRFSLLTVVVTCGPPSIPCPLSCVLSYKHSLSAILGTRHDGALRAPFHQIIMEEQNQEKLFQKTKWTCFSMNQLDGCLKKCPASFQKSTMLTSMSHSNDYCSLIKKPSRAVKNYFTCEREHLQRVQNNCGYMNFEGNVDINVICRLLDRYRRCYSMQQHKCAADALQIKEHIDDSLMQTFERLLKMNSNFFKIPPKCQSWRRHKLRPHSYKIPIDDEESEGSGDVIETFENITFAPTSTLMTSSSTSSKNFHRSPTMTSPLDPPRPSPQPRWLGNVDTTSALPTTPTTPEIIYRELSLINYPPSRSSSSSLSLFYVFILYLFTL